MHMRFLFLALIGLQSWVVSEVEVPVLDVYRMLQYDQNDRPFGSRRASVNMMAVSHNSRSDLSRRAVVLEFAQVTESLLDEILIERSAGALFIVLPKNIETVSEAVLAKWRTVENNLVNREVAVPVYFTFDGDHAQQLRSIIERQSEDTQLVVSGDTSIARGQSMEGVNYQALLAGAAGVDGADSAPTIAIVAHYDTFAISPELAVGADSNGSGVVALLQLARLFARLYNGARSHGAYSLVFVLTDGGKLNYAGTKHWVRHSDAALLDRVEFALCLDSIGLGEKLFLHVSRPIKDATVAKIYNALSESAGRAGVELKLVHKKINVSDAGVAWEHQPFSRRRIVAATLSRHPGPSPVLRATALDRRVEPATLTRNVHIVAEALAGLVYGLGGGHVVFNGSSPVQASFTAAWAEELAGVGRMAAYMDAGGGRALMEKAEGFLKEHATETLRQTFPLDSDRNFYRGSFKARVSVYTVRPLSFDLLMSLCVLAYLAALLVFFQGKEEALRTLSGLLRPGPGGSTGSASGRSKPPTKSRRDA